MYTLLFANERGEVLDRPGLLMLGQSGNSWVLPDEVEMIRLPEGSTLVSMPGCVPVGFDRRKNRPVAMREEGAVAAAAMLPQGFTRTYLPAFVSGPGGLPLPLFGYTAVGFRDGVIYAAAVKTDEHRKWNPVYYNTDDLPARVERLRQELPANSVIGQLSHCALEYGCFTAQNIFYRRWEGGIPTSPVCNADCIGCLSEAHAGSESPQCRLLSPPAVDEIVDVAVRHLVDEEAIISFGQGCEGEPSLNPDLIGQAIRLTRQATSKGTININTNAGYTRGIGRIVEAGLDSMRVTMFSCREREYNIYHRPRGYSLDDVGASIDIALSAGAQVAINLLVFPGFTDSQEEYKALLAFLRRHPVQMIQMRNLNLDPRVMAEHFPPSSPAMGIADLLSRLEDEVPGLIIGSYTRPARG